MAAPRIVLHLDMDAFFAAIEQRDDPALRGRPVLIGHPGPRGVVATASYEARPFGVRSAMPSVTAQRLCPDAVWVAPRFEAYREASQRIFALVHAAIPVVEQLSIDEAYGDLTGLVATLDEAAALARRLKEQIRAEVALNASVGISRCRFLAKVASDLEKPDGLCVLDDADVPTRLWPLGVRVIPGVGPKLEARLGELGIHTVGQLARTPEGRLAQVLGAAHAHELAERAQGRDDTPIAPEGERKQVSEERTYGTDLVDPEEIERELLARAEGVAAELRRKGVLARTVVLKVRDGRYQTWTRSHTPPEPVDLASELYAIGRMLLQTRIDLRGQGVRLLGLAGKELVHPEELAPSLFPDERRARERKVAAASDALRARFGEAAVRPARLLDADAPKPPVHEKARPPRD